MGRIEFGTDGIRGKYGEYVTREVAYLVADAAVSQLGLTNAVIGVDTRESGPQLASAMIAALTDRGVASEYVGIVPTPCIAWLASSVGAMGIVISASHNPTEYNGIKIFDSVGMKLDDVQQTRIEDAVNQIDLATVIIPEAELTVSNNATQHIDSWVDHIRQAIPLERTAFKIGVDCAHGAASPLAEKVFEGVSEQCNIVGDRPDGTNINDGFGSTHPEVVKKLVSDNGLDVGFALDGDADRLLLVDETGELVVGDEILAVIAKSFKARGKLDPPTVVTTIAANLGFDHGMDAVGAEVIRTDVGDRHILFQLNENGLLLGGEESGHLIRSDLAKTGDGLLASLSVLEVMAYHQKPLSHLVAEAMERVPEVTENIVVPDELKTDLVTQLEPTVDQCRQRLGDRGRLLVRASGTEPVVRMLIEHVNVDEAHQVAAVLTDALKRLVESHGDVS